MQHQKETEILKDIYLIKKDLSGGQLYHIVENIGSHLTIKVNQIIIQCKRRSTFSH